MGNIVKAEEVKFAYSSEEGVYHFALNGVSLEINEGEFVAILGHNGSGKSTFARVINALNIPTEGTMIVSAMDTKDEEKLFEIRKTAGMVFQNPDNQLVATVVEEDVAFGPENLGVPQPEIVARVDSALQAVNMEEFRKRAPHMLSGGQKQRVAIAGALAMKPKLIVFDEATAMLDPRGRGEIMEIIRRLNREQGMTIVLITHFMEEAVEADRAVIMAGGYVIAEDEPRKILYEREILAQAKLLPPFAAQMCGDLKAAGLAFEENCTTIDELVDELCRLK